MLTDWGDALGQQAQDRLKGSEKKKGRESIQKI
jgi:hypothetical protein